MPLYEFKCSKCGAISDALISPKEVPECGDEVNSDNIELLGECQKCNCKVFIRVPSAHGRMASWSNW